MIGQSWLVVMASWSCLVSIAGWVGLKALILAVDFHWLYCLVPPIILVALILWDSEDFTLRLRYWLDSRKNQWHFPIHSPSFIPHPYYLLFHILLTSSHSELHLPPIWPHSSVLPSFPPLYRCQSCYCVAKCEANWAPYTHSIMRLGLRRCRKDLFGWARCSFLCTFHSFIGRRRRCWIGLIYPL